MRSKRLLNLPDRPLLSVFFTAGFPRLHDTMELIKRLAAAGVDIIEVGFPFSDPLADGPTIQASNQRALENGMTLAFLFEQLAVLRSSVDIPVLLMGYLNPVEQFGFERFAHEAARCGIDGFIIPDLPFDEYQESYRSICVENGISPVFLVTSRTEAHRIHSFDAEEPAFLYILSSDAVTGGSVKISEQSEAFFRRISQMRLKSKTLVGFGVKDAQTFADVTRHTHGAIVGSAFIKAISTVERSSSDDQQSDFGSSGVIEMFIKSLR